MKKALFAYFFSLLYSVSFAESSDSFSERLKDINIPKEFALEEIIIGKNEAPIILVIYSSFTCSHCRSFHMNEFPKFIKKYVDTGKVKIYLRCYLDDVGALESSLLMRCLSQNNNDVSKIYNHIYEKQEEWIKSKEPRQYLKNMFMNIGYSTSDIDNCLLNNKLNTKISAGLMKEQKRAMHEIKISSVPAFIVNGKIHEGKITAEKLGEMCTTN